MKDTSFIDLTSNKNLNKMVIDERLIKTFNITMKNFQSYFNYMGLINGRNYQEFFKKYLFDPSNRLLIKCENLKEKTVGSYNYITRELLINDRYLNDKDYLINILTHEFIHFLVERHLRENNLIEDSIYDNDFVDEALTEMLKMRILPLTYQSYTPQIKMVKFMLDLNDKIVDFNNFLNAGKFLEIDDYLNMLFEIYLNYIEDDEHIYDARKKISYVNIQRYLIAKIDINISNIKDYENIIIKMSNRPVNDITFMNRFFKQLENKLCNNLNINDEIIRKRFIVKLKEFRLLTEYINNKRNFKYVCSFRYKNDIYEIDEKSNIYINEYFMKKLKTIFIDNYKIDLSHKRLHQLKIKKIKSKEELLNKRNKVIEILKYYKFISDNMIIDDKKLIKK